MRTLIELICWTGVAIGTSIITAFYWHILKKTEGKNE